MVGLLGLVVATLVGAAVVVASSSSFGAREYHAELEQTAGLRVGESVEIAGVDVGKVRSLALQGTHVLVTFTVDGSITLGSRSTATVRVATLLGTHYLSVVPDGRGELADDTIPLARTSVPYNLQDVLDKGTDQLDALDPGRLGQALSAVTTTLRASGPELGPAAAGITPMSRMITRQGAEYEALFGAARQVSDRLAASSGDVVSLMRTSNLFLAEMLKRRDKIHALLVNVQHLSTTVRAVVRENRSTLSPLLQDLDTVLTVLRERDKDLAVAIHKVAVSGRYLANATGNGPWAELYVPDGLPDNITCATKRC
jgi:phospholipid/cholesterol/gamma-HCH transport system substrate-binding protein